MMFAMISILIPPILMVVILNDIVYDGKMDRRMWVIRYLCSLLLINLIDLFVISYIRKSPEDIIRRLDANGCFAFKYVILSCALAFVLPQLLRFLKCRCTFSFEFRKERSSIQKIPIIELYALILALMNFIRVFDDNFWGDEGFSIQLAKMSFREMIYATANDVHPPLYYILIMAAYRLLGGYGWVYHFASLIPYLITILFALLVIKKCFGKGAAILFITFSSLLQNALTYNVEVRMYSWAALFILLSFYSLYLVLTEGKIIDYLFFVISTLAAAYSHYYAMISVAFYYLALLFYALNKKIKMWKVFLCYILAMIGYMPWMLIMIRTFRRTAGSFWMTEESIPSFQSSLGYFFQTEKIWFSAFMVLLTVGFFLIHLLCSLNILKIERVGEKFVIILQDRKERLSDVDTWMIWGIVSAVGTVLLGELISVTIRPAFINRYIYPVSVIIWLVASILVASLRIHRLALPIVLIMTLIVCIPQYKRIYDTERAENVLCTDTKKCILANVDEDDLILTDSVHLNWTVLDYYVPMVKHQRVKTSFEGGDVFPRYWFVWTRHLEESDIKWLEDHAGYIATEVYHDGLLGGYPVHFYRLDQVDQGEER